jgi:hypothetical protein
LIRCVSAWLNFFCGKHISRINNWSVNWLNLIVPNNWFSGLVWNNSAIHSVVGKTSWQCSFVRSIDFLPRFSRIAHKSGCCCCCCCCSSGPGAKAPVALQPLGLLYTLFSRSSHCRRQVSPRPTRRERSKQREVEL